MVTTNQAKDLIEAHIETTNIIEVPLMDTLGGYLAEHVFSPINIPSFSNSAMDGYAFRYIDTLTTDTFKIVGEVAAGKNLSVNIGFGEAVRIFTVAKIPAGVDTVLLQ